MKVPSILLGLGVTAAAFAAGNVVVRLLVGTVPIADPTADVGVLLPLLVSAAVVALAADRDRARELAPRWLTDRGLPHTDALEEAAVAWIQRARTARGIGFASVVAAMAVPAWLVNVSGLRMGDPVRDELLAFTGTTAGLSWPILGYLLGALIAELTRRGVRTETPDGPRRADLRPREVAGYLQPFSRVGPRALALLAAVTVAAETLLGREPVSGPSGPRVLLLAVVVLAISEAVYRGVLRRRQRATEPLAIAFDDAARSTTVHAVAGSAIGLIGTSLGDHLQGLAAAPDGSGLLGWLALVVGIGSFGVWLGHGVGLAHRVGRGGTTAPVEATATAEGSPS